MKRETRLLRYGKAVNIGGINEAYKLLNKTRKNYARYLVETYGYPVNIAIQSAYVFGFDNYPYDYRSKCPTREKRTRESFGRW